MRLPKSRVAKATLLLRHANLIGTVSGHTFRGNRLLGPLRRWRQPAATLDASHQESENLASTSDDDIPSQEEYIAHCQQFYSIPGLIDISAGPGGLPFITLRHPNGAHAQICLHGGTITSWQGTEGKENLHLRDGNAFDGVQPIAGGIGIAWPQIGPGGLPLHGLLRTMHWSLVESSAYEGSDDPAPTISLYVDSSSEGTDDWPYSFEAVYSISLRAAQPPGLHPREQAEEAERQLELLSDENRRELKRKRVEAERAAAAALAAENADSDDDANIKTSTTRRTSSSSAAVSSSGTDVAEPARSVSPPSILQCSLQIHNSSSEEFKFTSGLLTHLASEDVRENKKFVKVLGLGGKYVLDYAADPMRPSLFVEQDDFLFFDADSGKNVDKLYVDCDDEGHVLFCPGTQSYVEIEHPLGFTDLEVLHPAAAAPDVARRSVCLASARKAKPITLPPGGTWSGEMKLSSYNRYWDLPPFEKEDPTTVPVPKREDALPPRRMHDEEEFGYVDG
ncbi:hypothetical protein Ndes2526B_g07727 [Nannochloris sp. 'desiccata']